MSSTISTGFGSVNVGANGRTSIGTTVFGIDVNKLVEDLVAAKKVSTTAVQTKVSTNTLRTTAVDGLKTLTTGLNNALRDLRTPTVSQGGINVFATKSASLTASGGSTAASLVSTTVTPSAINGTFTLKINRLATSDIVNGTAALASATATPISAPGNLVINGKSISLTAASDLTSIRDAINSTSGIGVSANIVKYSNSDYRLSLASTTTGDAIDFSGSTASVLTDLGLSASGATDTSLSAELVYNGNTVTRTTNTVNDLVTGVTLNLTAADPATTITAKVGADTAGIKTAIKKFVDTYNSVLEYSKQQRAVNADGSIAETSVLFNDNNLRNITSNMQRIVSGAVGGVTGLNNLRDAGITLDANNKLVINDTTLDSAIAKKTTEIAGLFGFQSNASSTSLAVLSRPTTLNSTLTGVPITVRVLETTAGGSATSAELEYTIGGTTTTVTSTIANGIITADPNSALSGFAFGYAGAVINSGDPAFSATITPTQGLADLLAGVTDTYVKAGGTLDAQLKDITDSSTKLNKKIETINSQAELYRARLEAQFLRVQQTSSQLETIKASLISTFEAQNKN
ncbi:MAG: flagellar filament capping protein FliD [Thalassospira sp.]|nr:flagellar filament capping protein FliD [Thalassospira sp.]